MLRLLAEQLGQNEIWVHLDKSVDMAKYLESAGGLMPENMHFVSRRVNVRWGGYSVVQAMRACAVEAMASAEKDDHIVFISGHCYPIRPVEQLLAYLESAPNVQHVRAYRLTDYPRWHTDRYARSHWFDLRLPRFTAASMRRIVRNAVKYLSFALPRKRTGLDVVAGSQWMALTKECLQEAFEALDTKEYRIFRNSFAPDEMAIQTFIFNSRWANATSMKGIEEISNDDISSIPNFHFLRPGLSGLATQDDVNSAFARGSFFIRKIDSSNIANTIKSIIALTI